MTERERFEAWARSRWSHPEDFDRRIKAIDKYNSYEVQAAWEAWKERASQSAPSVPDDMMRDARRYLWLRNAALDWYVGLEYATYNDVVCSGGYCNYAGGGVTLDSAIDALLAAAPEAKP